MPKYNKLVRDRIPEIAESMDFEGMMEAEAAHKAHFSALHEKLLETWPNLLALGAGTCTRCRECTYPDNPCRMPEKRLTSMEASGLVVSEVCTAAGIPYNHGPLTITYSSCVLY